MMTTLGDRPGGYWIFLLVLPMLSALSLERCKAEGPELPAQIDRLVQPYLDESIVVGMVVGVIREDDSVIRGYGRVSRDEPAKPTGQTVYEIGSLTKTFTGLLLADAVANGRMQLDRPIADLLPDGGRIPQHADGPIRLVHLATHASGLPRLPSNLSPSDPRDPYADYGAEELFRFLSSHSPTRGPATELEYSNTGFGLLGQILADQADTSYGELVVSVIAEPLRMKDTAVDLNKSMRARLAPPYNGELAEDHNWNFQAMAGAGAVRSSGDDMLRYARAHLHPPQGPLGKAIKLAWEVHQPAIKAEDFAMGLGWHVARDGATRWHNGQTGGYHSMLMINRPANVAVVVLANTATMEVDTLAEQLVRMLVGVPEQPREFQKTADVPLDQMQRLVGRYQLAPDFVLTAKLEDEKLMVGATGQPFFRVFPKSETEWIYRVVDASLTFELGDKGPATAVVLHQNGLKQRAERVK